MDTVYIKVYHYFPPCINPETYKVIEKANIIQYSLVIKPKPIESKYTPKQKDIIII